ncbi:MAG: FAD-dependent oxidoreductase [Proteobacteria bacterium]|nr:FAD-dependent oxidoreductase [Pseudomonadota bacterium]
MDEMETDVAVLGSGCAGSAAACTAAALGARVLLIEKAAQIGGPVKGAHGPFAVESAMQRERQLAFRREDAFRLFMEHTHWRADARLVSAYVNRSAETIEWLQSLGVVFSDVVAYFEGAEYTWHFKAPGGPGITELIHARAQQLGVRTLTATTAARLTKHGGRVDGLVARDAAGTEFAVRAKAVVICTGGFGGNAEWIRRHTGFTQGENLFSFAFPELQGDGIRMAWDAGAGRSPMIMQTYVCMPEPHWGPGGTPFELGTFRQPGLMVNALGERFMNEETMRNPAFAANAVARQKGGCGFMLFDEATNRHYETHDWDFQMSKLPVTRSHDAAGFIAKARAEGYRHLFAADSLQALARQMDMPAAALAATVAEYNAACDSGRDALFHKPARHLRPLRSAPFYAARFYLGGYGSLGGISINHRTQVLTPEQDVIPGLYAAGRDANAIYGDTYPYVMAGNDSSFDFNTGRIAGEQAVQGLKPF